MAKSMPGRCNFHLETAAGKPRKRPVQIAVNLSLKTKVAVVTGAGRASGDRRLSLWRRRGRGRCGFPQRRAMRQTGQTIRQAGGVACAMPADVSRLKRWKN